MVINNTTSFKYLDEFFAKYPDVIFITLDKNTSYKEVIKNILVLLKQNPSKQIILLSSIEEHVENKNNKNLENYKKFVKLIGNKGYSINYVRLGEVLENTDNIINKKIAQILKQKKTFFTNNKQSYYFISKTDIEKGLEKLIKNSVKGKIFNFSLNKINEEKLLITLEEYFKFKKELVKVNSSKIKRTVPNFKSLDLINFKPEITTKHFIKSKAPIVESKTEYKQGKKLNLNFNLKIKQIKKKHVVWFLVVITTWVTFSIIDFATDNYFLYTNVKTLNTEKAIFYANKLRQRFLPTPVGNNYKNIYSSIYYGATALDLIKSPAALEQKQAIIESLAKSVEYSKEINKNLLLTPVEKNYYDKIKPLITEIEYNKGYINLVDLALSTKQELNFIVLIQNSNELRTSGGFVGSYALVNIKDKKINNIKFDDIYNIDGVLKQMNPPYLVKSPDEIKSFLKTDYLYARDLNILLNDKQKNQAYIKYFENTLNIKIDGIAYIDLNVIKNILEYTGPIYLSSYEKTVNKDNFDTLAQTYSEKNYYEGSSQKQNFLSLVGSRAIEEITKKGMNTSGFIISILKSINSNDLQVFSPNPYLDNKLENSGMYKPINSLSNKEFIYIVENNLGENKVNKLTEKKVSYTVSYDVRRGVKITDVEVNLKNNSKDTTFPYGDYKGLLSIITPPKLFISATKAIYKDKEVDIANTRSITDLGNMAAINLPFSIKPGEETTLVVSYEEESPNYDSKNHVFYVFKQPGAKPYTLNLNFSIPDKVEKKLSAQIDKNTEFTIK